MPTKARWLQAGLPRHARVNRGVSEVGFSMISRYADGRVRLESYQSEAGGRAALAGRIAEFRSDGMTIVQSEKEYVISDRTGAFALSLRIETRRAGLEDDPAP